MDKENNVFLRQLRNKLGYGCGWRFIDALWDKIAVWVFIIPLWLFVLFITFHIKILWIP